jgi:hypothetical protein
MPKLAGRRLTLRHLYLILSIALFFVPWLAFRGNTYSGLTFREFAAAHGAAATGSTLPPITWSFVVFAPVAAVAGLLLEWRDGPRTTADFLAGCAVFIGPIALGFAAFEEQARLLPGAYAAFVLAAAMLATDLLRGQRSEDGQR